MKVKYDTIGKNYNVTRKADSLLADNLIKHLAPNQTGTYLDIGCGTGSYTHEFQKRGYNFIGIDPSKRMLAVAKKRNSKIAWKLGSAENTGLSPNQVDGIIGSLTIHHWADLEKAFHELYSILKPAGKMVVFTSTPIQMQGYWLNHYFPKMLADSMIQMPALPKVQQAMENAGFEMVKTEKYFIQPDLEDKFLYCGKHQPTLYFDKHIRNGISSFSSLSNQLEVAHGLSALKSDIDSGKITRIINEYENQLGDYLYIIVKKPANRDERI